MKAEDCFADFIRREHLIAEGQRVLLAVSGGRDSVAMAHLFKSAALPFAIAHCNFHLRPGDCDRDERFVRQLANDYDVDCHVAQFQTAEYAEQQHLSVEEAAREQRYDFFEAVRNEHGYDLIATAHHRDDSIETFFINLLRGSGIHGLHGIPLRNGRIVRPMLCLSRSDVNEYVERHGLKYVEDSTNSQTLYLRNRIRLQLLPMLRQLSPSFDTTMQGNMERLAGAAKVFDSAIDAIRSSVQPAAQQCKDTNAGIVIPIDFIESQATPATVLYELLKPYGFTGDVVSNIVGSLHGRSGLRFFSPTHCLVKDRTALLVAPRAGQDDECIVISADELVDATQPLVKQCVCFEVVDIQDVSPVKARRNEAFFDFDGLRFPLLLRHWRRGDRIHPFGMKGSRLVSDIFSDLKLSLPEKQRVWLLCDAEGTVLWVVGLRASSCSPVGPGSRKVLHVSVGL